MVYTEENMSNLHDAEKIVTVVDNGTLTRTKCGDWNGYRKRDGNYIT